MKTYKLSANQEEFIKKIQEELVLDESIEVMLTSILEWGFYSDFQKQILKDLRLRYVRHLGEHITNERFRDLI